MARKSLKGLTVALDEEIRISGHTWNMKQKKKKPLKSSSNLRSKAGSYECSHIEHSSQAGEHLHKHCRNCEYDWCELTLDARKE